MKYSWIWTCAWLLSVRAVKQQVSKLAAHRALLSTFTEVKVQHADEWNLEDLENSILELSREEATPALTPLTAAIRTMLWDQLAPQIFEHHNKSQKEMDDTQYVVDSCNATTQLMNYSVPILSEDHKACRLQEANLYQEIRLINAKIIHYTLTVDEKCSKLKDNKTLPDELPDTCDRSCNETYEQHAMRISDFFASKIAQWEEANNSCWNDMTILEELKDNLTKKTDEWTNKTVQCDELQRRLDNAACSLHLNHLHCASEQQCIQQATETYSVANATIVDGLISRYGLWRGLKRIECLLSVLDVSDSSTYQKIEDCRATDYACPANLTLRYNYRADGPDPFDIRCNGAQLNYYLNDDTADTTITEEDMNESDYYACMQSCEEDIVSPQLRVTPVNGGQNGSVVDGGSPGTNWTGPGGMKYLLDGSPAKAGAGAGLTENGTAGCVAWMWKQTSSSAGTCKRFDRYPNYDRMLAAGDPLLGNSSEIKYYSGYCNLTKIHDGVEACLQWKGLVIPSPTCLDAGNPKYLLVPGTPTYEAAEYDILPVNAPAADCVAKCCTKCVLYPCNSSTTLRSDAADIDRISIGSYSPSDNPTCCTEPGEVTWVYDEWPTPACSFACGRAAVFDTRLVMCINRSSNTTADEDQCGVPKPVSLRQTCPATLPCDTCAQSDCLGHYVLANSVTTCATSVCSMTDCCIAVEWRSGPWQKMVEGPCSNACNQPEIIETRQVTCVSKVTGREVPGRCDLLAENPPASQRQVCNATDPCPVCAASDCPVGLALIQPAPTCKGLANCSAASCCVEVAWNYSRWSEVTQSCPVQCNSGAVTEDREVKCTEKTTGVVRDDSLCGGTKPTTQRIVCAATQACNKWTFQHWTPLNASSCTAACGTAEVIETRSVYCEDINDGSIKADTSCSGDKPATSRVKCPQTPPCVTCLGHQCPVGYTSKTPIDIPISCASADSCTTSECCNPMAFDYQPFPAVPCNYSCGLSPVTQVRPVKCRETGQASHCKDPKVGHYFNAYAKTVDSYEATDASLCRNLCETDATCTGWSWYQTNAQSGTCRRHESVQQGVLVHAASDPGKWIAGECTLPAANISAARRIFNESYCVGAKPDGQRTACNATNPCSNCSMYTCPLMDLPEDCDCFLCGQNETSSLQGNICQPENELCQGCYTKAKTACDCTKGKAFARITLNKPAATTCRNSTCDYRDCCEEPRLAWTAINQSTVERHLRQRGMSEESITVDGALQLAQNGYAYKFSNTSATSVNMGYFQSSKLTVEVFVKLGSGSKAQTIIQKNGGYKNGGLWAITSTAEGNISAHSYKNNHYDTQISCTCSGSWLERWVHVALTYDGQGNGLSLYVQGQNCCDMTSTARWSDEGMKSLASPIIVGLSLDGYFNGEIHAARVWDYYANATEIGQLAGLYTSAGHPWTTSASLQCQGNALAQLQKESWQDCKQQCSDTHACRAAQFYQNNKTCISLPVYGCQDQTVCGCSANPASLVANNIGACSSGGAFVWRVAVTTQDSSATASFTELTFTDSVGQVFESVTSPGRDETGSGPTNCAPLNDGSESGTGCNLKTRSQQGFLEYPYSQCRFPAYLSYAISSGTSLPSSFYVSYQKSSGRWVDCEPVQHSGTVVTGLVQKQLICRELLQGTPEWWEDLYGTYT